MTDTNTDKPLTSSQQRVIEFVSRVVREADFAKVAEHGDVMRRALGRNFRPPELLLALITAVASVSATYARICKNEIDLSDDEMETAVRAMLAHVQREMKTNAVAARIH